jgi:hypothetical protein
MKKLLCLVFFGLIAQITTAQVLGINSPTSINLKCAINVPAVGGANAPTIYIFGEQGLGFVSKDKCQSWKQLDIDPIKKRTINLATRVNDTLIFLSGGRENDLLKYSTDNGATFKDFPFEALDASGKLHDTPIRAIIPVANWNYSIVAFMQTKQFALWQDYRWMNSGIPVQAYDFQDPSDVFVYLGGHKDGDYIVTYARSIIHGTSGYLPYFGLGVVKLKQAAPYAEVKFSQSLSDSISSVASYQGKCLVSFHTKRAGNYNYEGMVNPFAGVTSFIDYYQFTDLTPEQSIKSSLITPAHAQFWHVGGDLNGKNGFIIKNRVIVQRSQSSGLNMMIDISDSNNADAILAIGNNGKIYSTRTDLAQAIPDAVIGWEKADNFSAYPNPFNSELTIKSSSEAIVTLSDVLGTVIKQIRVEPGDNRISLVGLKTGIYFLTNKKQTLKLIKQ